MSLYKTQLEGHKAVIPILSQIIELENKILDLQEKLLELEYDIVMPKTVLRATREHYKEYVEVYYTQKHLLLVKYHEFLKELHPSTLETILSRNNAKVLETPNQ